MPSFDRGFIKWQAFEALISSKEVLKKIEAQKITKKPKLFDEKKEELNTLIMENYLSQSNINLFFFENNKIKKVTTTIKNIYPEYNILKLANNKVISFDQILNIMSI